MQEYGERCQQDGVQACLLSTGETMNRKCSDVVNSEVEGRAAIALHGRPRVISRQSENRQPTAQLLFPVFSELLSLLTLQHLLLPLHEVGVTVWPDRQFAFLSSSEFCIQLPELFEQQRKRSKISDDVVEHQ